MQTYQRFNNIYPLNLLSLQELFALPVKFRNFAMMRILVTIFLFFFCVHSNAGIKPGFIKEEARDMLAICNSFTFIDLYNSDKEIIPEGYKKRYTSGVFGMDHKYQVFQKGNIAVINIRGSSDKQISWLANVHSSMIPAADTIEISGEKIPYCFSKDEFAAVHSGYALGVAFLSQDIVLQIKLLNMEGVYDILLTGHSQGGALINLLRAYLENLPEGVISPKNNFKSYSFASPMVGNKAFVQSYNGQFAANKTSFNIINPADPIPTFPLNFNDTNFVMDNLKNLIVERESFNVKYMMSDGAALLLEKKLGKYMQRISGSASEKISKDTGPVVLPEFVEDINYHKLNNLITLKPVEYPKILKDSSILQNDSLMMLYSRDENGYFLKEDLYKSASWTYQHKPYNYYVSFLNMFFKEEYVTVKKYLPENL